MENDFSVDEIGMYTHFLTKEGILFTAREYYPSLNKIRAVPCYYFDKFGNRKSNQLKLLFNRSVDEFGDIWLNKLKPGYITNTNVGQAILVPLDDIALFMDPFNLPEKTKKVISKTKFQEIINALKNLGINEKDIGIYGSYLSGLQNETSDIDIAIRGIANMRLTKKNMDRLRKYLGAVGSLSEKRKIDTIKKYNLEYNAENNDFSEMIARRWSTIRKGEEYTIKIMFTYKKGEKPKDLVPEKFCEETTIEGRVCDDLGVCYMPRHFTIENKESKFKVITYFYNFYFAVKNGDYVKISGTLSDDGKAILLHNRRLHGIKFMNKQVNLGEQNK